MSKNHHGKYFDENSVKKLWYSDLMKLFSFVTIDSV